MQLTPDIIDAIFINFRLDFQQAYERAAPWWNKVATLTNSTTRENRYAWMKLIARLRQWVGERKFNNLVSRGYAIVNLPFELSLEIDQDSIEDDQIGVYTPHMQMMGEQAARWPDDLMTTLIQGGLTGTAFDGQPFFDPSHPVDSDDSSKGTYANNFPNTPFSADSYAAVRAAMMSIKGEDNKPLAIMPNLIICPPQLEVPIKRVLNGDMTAQTFSNGAGISAAAQVHNPLKNTAEVLMIPELSNEGDTWYLADMSKPIRPFIFQQRKAPVLEQLISQTDANVFLHKKFWVGVQSRGAGGYSLPFLCSRITAQAA